MGYVSRLHDKGGPDRPRADADPLRVALAGAVAQAKDAKAAVARQRSAMDRLRVEAIDAEQAVEAAQKAVAKSKLDDAEAIALAAAQDALAPAGSVRRARRAAEDAGDRFDALQAARAKLKANLPELEAEALKADIAVEAAISAIFAPLAERLIEQGERIARSLRPIREALATLWGASTPAKYADAIAFEQAQLPLADTKKAVAEYLRNSNLVERAQPDPWAAARARLREDPQAELSEFAALLWANLPNEL